MHLLTVTIIKLLDHEHETICTSIWMDTENLLLLTCFSCAFLQFNYLVNSQRTIKVFIGLYLLVLFL